jgi:hypothetical protein
LNQWCCGIFKGWFEDAGHRGVGIVVHRNPDGEPAFIIQLRSVEPGTSLPEGFSGPVALVSEVHIQHCPWCGRNLEKSYRKQVDAMIRPGLRASFPGMRPE